MLFSSWSKFDVLTLLVEIAFVDLFDICCF